MGEVEWKIATKVVGKVGKVGRNEKVLRKEGRNGKENKRKVVRKVVKKVRRR